MRLTRVHVNVPLPVDNVLQLPDDVAVHLGRVLRLQPGDACVLFNGDGFDYEGSVETMDRRAGTVRITGRQAASRESPLAVTLIQGIARGDKMDWILQKATELGVTGIIPVQSQRSEVKLSGERAAKRLAHWQEVVISACEQSGRAIVPQVHPPSALQSLDVNAAHRLLLEPTATAAIRDLGIQAGSGVAIAIGPEGGWSDLDLSQLAALGFRGLRMGPRILRTETAGMAAISALQCLFGDF